MRPAASDQIGRPIMKKTIEQLVRELGRHQVQETMRALLSGNDTQCFTSDQFIEKHLAMHHKPDDPYLDGYRRVWKERWLRGWMKKFKIQEVKPDVWKEN